MSTASARRKGLILTLSIMAIGTRHHRVHALLCDIGVAAPIIVVAGRLLQGFSAGVELGGVSVYLAEIATPKDDRGFVVSFQSASQQVAVFVAALIGYVINLSLPTDEILKWVWRIPFRHRLFDRAGDLRAAPLAEETAEFLARKRHPTPSEIYRALAAERQHGGARMLMVMLTTVAFYFITVYTPALARR